MFDRLEPTDVQAFIPQGAIEALDKCIIGGLSRTTEIDSAPNEQNVTLTAAIIDIAQARPRFGYRRIHDLLRPAHPKVNHERIYQLYSEAKLAVKKRKKEAVNEVWSMGFVSDSQWPPPQVLYRCRRCQP